MVGGSIHDDGDDDFDDDFDDVGESGGLLKIKMRGREWNIGWGLGEP